MSPHSHLCQGYKRKFQSYYSVVKFEALKRACHVRFYFGRGSVIINKIVGKRTSIIWLNIHQQRVNFHVYYTNIHQCMPNQVFLKRLGKPLKKPLNLWPRSYLLLKRLRKKMHEKYLKSHIKRAKTCKNGKNAWVF